MEEKFKSAVSTFEYLNLTYPAIKSVKLLSSGPKSLTLKTMFSKTNLLKFEEKLHSQIVQVNLETSEV